MPEIKDKVPVSATRREAGYIAPILGRKSLRDVFGFPGFPLIRAGETITEPIMEKAQAMGKLFELTAATREN